jgi:SAM-dependent methyltransferase
MGRISQQQRSKIMPIDEQRLDEFLGRVFSDLSSGYAGVMVALGHKLGLYKAMAGRGPLSSREVAKAAGCHERYVREWLNSQAAGGYVAYHPSSATYELPDEHAAVLAHEDSPAFFPPAWEVVASLWFDEDKALEAFTTGKGIAWSDHDGRLFCGCAAFFRTGYKANLTSSWIPALDGVEDKLRAGAKVADIGCGYGHSTILMAEAFPNSRFVGIDSHSGSIEAARENAREAGVLDRVTFEVGNAQTYPAEGYDLICFFDCLHDLGDPVGAAGHAAKALSKDGTVLLVEPFAHDRTEDNFNPIGRLYYAASTTLCCAHSLSEEVGLALGAQAGPARLSDVFAKAGFTSLHPALSTPFNLVLEAKL